MAQPTPAAMSDEPTGPLGRLARSARKHGLLGSLRVLATAAVVAALLWYSQPTLLWLALGTPIALFGIFWRVWASGHLLKSRELAVSGPYRHVQNPLYFGRLCLLTGFGIMAYMPFAWQGRTVPANLLILAGMLTVFFAYYIPRKRRVEGERLARLHGDSYVQWAKAVPLIIPAPRAWGQNVRPWSAERFHDNSEGWTVAIVLAVIVGFWIKAFLPG
jgi:protein-S-isoprenylcysteine O-methyltransferase Ste14